VDILIALGCSLLVLAVVMTAAWALAMRTGNGGWADTVWTFGVGLSALTAIAVLAGGQPGSRHLLVAALAALWSLRLGTYLYTRTRGKAEDARYADLRRQWGETHPRRLFLFLQAQALAALPLTGAIALAADRPGALDAADAIGVAIALAGILGTAVSDWQLARFKADPGNKGQICDAGLWSLSRHPNYFFEWLTWCAWPVIAFAASGGYLIGLLALAAPALMYYLLVHVSGLPPLEAHMERSRGAAFAAYKARTPAFFPRFPWPATKDAGRPGLGGSR
jgi:steroid 5-alpha reductase family enzyme